MGAGAGSAMKLVLCSTGTGRACGENGVQVLTVSQYIDIPSPSALSNPKAGLRSRLIYSMSFFHFQIIWPPCLSAWKPLKEAHLTWSDEWNSFLR